ncbi:hypothetical protein A2U01_0099018, partial [Trifolium medium]|nr:hypothetical protein [Trifolium medium]
PHFEDADWSE